MWKIEVRNNSRYLPDYPDDKLSFYNITHEGNIKVGVKAIEDFQRSTTTCNLEQRVGEQHERFLKFQMWNCITRVISDHKRILNDGRLTAFERCIPVGLYYREICRDSPHIRETIHQETERQKAKQDLTSVHHTEANFNLILSLPCGIAYSNLFSETHINL
jgi:hypothetical protein